MRINDLGRRINDINIFLFYAGVVAGMICCANLLEVKVRIVDDAL